MSVRFLGQHLGRDIHEARIGDSDGLSLGVMSYGAAIRDMRVEGVAGGRSVVLGFDRLEDYITHSPHFGAVAGRFANRIKSGRFQLDGTEHQLSLNQAGQHHLHGGGANGFGRTPWTLIGKDARHAVFERVSPAGEQGYPGTLTARVTYRCVGSRTLRIELRATTDAPTIVNLATHSYFNLEGSDTILDHQLMMDADRFTPVDADLIPTGEIQAVSGAHDFRTPKTLRSAGQTFDTNFVLTREHIDGTLHRAAVLRPSDGSTRLEVWTTEPALQLYDGSKLGLAVPGLDGQWYGKHAGVCLEPQRYPDAPNHAHFPSAVLRPYETYQQVTEYRFG
jgi:aldose 1-epimerase